MSSYHFNNLPPQMLVKDQASATREELIEGNLKLVVYLANKWATGHRYDCVDDLIQEGSLGLMRAAELFDPKNGCSFGTYASFHVKQRMRLFFRNKLHLIRIPVFQHERIQKGIHNKSTHLAVEALQVSSIDLEIADGGTFGDVIPDENVQTPLQEYEESEKLKHLKEAINDSGVLTDREKDILNRRFGLDGECSQTLDEVGAVYGITRERIRQIEYKSLKKLKAYFNKNEIVFNL